MFSHLKKLMMDKNFDSDDKAMQTVENYMRDLAFGFFSDGIQSLRDR